jgi:GTP cyclohydrolase II
MMKEVLLGTEKDTTIHVAVKLLGILGEYSQEKITNLRVDKGCTVAEVIQEIVADLGNDFKHTLQDRQGNLNGGIEVVLNREHISAYQLNDIRIWQDSELILVPIIAGGIRPGRSISEHGGHDV